jgi:uncharacterized protein
MYITQKQLDNLEKSLAHGKVIVIYGAYRTGKTTLLQQFLRGVNEPYLLVNGEDITAQGSWPVS